ncbi:head maturation protease, ClpP-related [Dysgonomonas termitidis]|uniref:Head maturation protease, ClpP-related n=1 Tax=Dysgonomonas termitidis TaxID=1516126 RepID=A0ABV9KTQ8_9BACT
MAKQVLKLYGNIWQWGDNSAEAFIARLNYAVSFRPEVIELHIHCNGGGVLEGIAIHNAIKACEIPVDAYIDGVCASMATIIMLACRNIYMADNAFLMIHAPNGYAEGTSKDFVRTARLLRSMEANFRAAYMAKTGKTEAEVAAWMDGENWFSAKEAMDEKLINGIIPSVDQSTVQKEEIKTLTPAGLLQRYAALAKEKVQPINKNKMDKEALIKKYGLKTVTAENSEDEIYEAIANESKAKAEASLQAEREKQVTAVIEAAKGPKKLTKEQAETFTRIGNTLGMQALQTALDAVMPPLTIGKVIKNQGGDSQATGREGWTWDDYQKNDSAALEALEKSDQETFRALYEAKYGK